LKAVIVSGLWPPDVGGPASHAPDVCDWLFERGHDVSAVTFADAPPEPRPYPVRWISRRLPIGVRHAVAAARVAGLARHADVVYSISMLGRTSVAAALTGTPHVVKLTTDPVFERSLHWKLAGSDLDEFQATSGARIGVLRRIRDHALAGASRVVLASHTLQELAHDWGVPREKTTLLPNPVEPPARLDSAEAMRRRFRLQGPTFVFAGRLVPQKAVDVALEAIRRTDDATLVVVGDGPERDALERRARALGLNGRARFIGAHPRRTVFELLHAADGAILSSSWENCPHVAVEALSVGTPVLATAAGGVTEIVRDGWNGLLAPVGNAEALAFTLTRYMGDMSLQARLREHAVDSVAQFTPAPILTRLEQLLAEAR
jgi:glycosyltransferase involved in cell wall biosynthesis